VGLQDMRSKIKEKDLKIAIYLTSFFLFVEIFGGYLFGSVSLISDAIHMSRDVFSLYISWFAINLAKKLPTNKMTFGYHRAEVFAAFINGLILIGVCIVILYSAYLRMVNPNEVKSIGMLSVASLGFLANLYVLRKLKKYEDDINIKSAYLHVLTDAISSISIIIGAIIIFFTGFYLIDPLLSVGIILLVLISMIRVVKESINILMEGVAGNINIGEIIKEMKKVKGVADVHDVHIWALCPNVNVLTAHIYTCNKSLSTTKKITKILNRKLRKFNIFHATFQFECEKCKNSRNIEMIEHH
jgi:cobalt-zinc-cadmium efflux system protein